MKRDMDLCREILRKMEEHPNPEGPVEIKVDGRSPQEIAYHLYLLNQAGLIDAIDATSSGGIDFIPVRLTWWGQEFLATAGNDTVWRRAKERVLGAASGLAFDVVKAVLLDEIKNGLGLR
jgi:hypothetical protein